MILQRNLRLFGVGREERRESEKHPNEMIDVQFIRRSIENGYRAHNPFWKEDCRKFWRISENPIAGFNNPDIRPSTAKSGSTDPSFSLLNVQRHTRFPVEYFKNMVRRKRRTANNHRTAQLKRSGRRQRGRKEVENSSERFPSRINKKTFSLSFCPTRFRQQTDAKISLMFPSRFHFRPATRAPSLSRFFVCTLLSVAHGLCVEFCTSSAAF